MSIINELKIEQIQGSYFQICGQGYFDLSSVFSVDNICAESFECSFTLSGKFDSSVKKVITLDVDGRLDYIRENKDRPEADLDKEFSQKVIDELTRFIENTLLPAIVRCQS